MADELPEVEQRFVADMAEYLDRLQAAIEEARRFADANREAQAALNDVRDHAAEAGSAVGHYRDEADAADRADHGLRDSAIEAGAALGHVRDEALLAAAAIHRLHDESSTPLKDVSHGLGDVAKAAEDAAGAIGGGGGVGGAGGGGLAGALGGMPMVIGAIAVPLAFLAAVLAGPVIAGIFAVTASIGALGIVAIPTFKDISAFFTATSASQRKAAWKAMDPAEHGVTRHLQDLQHTFDGIVKAVQPSLIRMFGDALKVVDALLPSLKPLAEAAANAFGGFFNQIAGWLNGPSGQKFLHWLDTSAPGAMRDFTTVLWDTMNVVGRVFDFLRNAGDAWYRHFSQGAHQISEALDASRKAIEDWAHNVAAHFDEVRHDVATWGHDVAHTFDDVRHTVASWAHDVAHDFDVFRHSQAQFGAFEHDIEFGFGHIRHISAVVFGFLRHEAASALDAMRSNAAANFAQMRHDIAHWADDAGHDVLVVADWFRSLPGRIISELASLPGQMYTIGLNIMEGLLHGIESMVGSVLSTVGHVASSILGSIGRFLGIGSPARKTFEQGAWIGQGWVNGILSTVPQLQAALSHMAGLVTAPAGGNLALAGIGSRGGAATVSGPVNVTVPATVSAVASPEFLHGLQQIIQEAVLRYVLNNQGNGMFLPGKLS